MMALSPTFTSANDQRSDLHDLERRSLDKAKIHKVAAQSPLAVELDDDGALPHLYICQRFHASPFPMQSRLGNHDVARNP